MLIKICTKYTKKNKFIKELKLNDLEIKIQVKSCIGMCKSCKSKPTAIIDNKKIKKKNIKKFIKNLNRFYKK